MVPALTRRAEKRRPKGIPYREVCIPEFCCGREEKPIARSGQEFCTLGSGTDLGVKGILPALASLGRLSGPGPSSELNRECGFGALPSKAIKRNFYTDKGLGDFSGTFKLVGAVH